MSIEHDHVVGRVEVVSAAVLMLCEKDVADLIKASLYHCTEFKPIPARMQCSLLPIPRKVALLARKRPFYPLSG